MAATTMVVTNTTLVSISCAGVTIASLQSATFSGNAISAACTDVALRAMFISGAVTISINNTPIPSSNSGSSLLLDGLAAGNIVVATA